MSSEQSKHICLNCLLKPYLNNAFIFGFYLQITSNCGTNQSSTFVPKFLKWCYCPIIEFFLWEHFFLMSWQTIPVLSRSAPCVASYSVIKKGLATFKMIGIFLSFVGASNFTIVKRNAIILDIRLRHSFFHNKMAHVIINNVCLLVSVIVIAFQFSLAIVNLFTLYPLWQKDKLYKYEEIFCSMEYGMWISFLISEIAYLFLLAGIIGFVTVKEYQQLSKELTLLLRNSNHLRLKLEEFMSHHQELWDFISIINNKLYFLVLVVHIYLTFGTCFAYYMYLFLGIDKAFEFILLGLIIIGTIVCIIYGFLVCWIAFTMENTFQDIRRYAGFNLSLQMKLKILNFMKRFGTVALTLSIGGVLDVTKRFPFQLAKTLHSIFSGLLKLRDVSYKRRRCDEISIHNRTVF
ncbi:uncharacterized protein LOC111632741 isoform X2 [Centruroides sculpturatus]|uniref:uncharacterized protein LOC111632741 isoform X2 n=1 Tax=Centruroides sculpturatus TaxID=218467 RepID=UPI000C6C9FC7|nr:uncharacterized protein LOC111632741 isoform X2 [Centruroides sculpturatus]